MPLTRTPRLDHSSASDDVIWFTAPAAAHAATEFHSPRTASPEPMFTIRPLSWASIRLPTAWLHRNFDLTLNSISVCHSDSSTSSKGLPNSAQALLTRMSTLPNSSTTCCVIASTSAAFVMSVAMLSARRPCSSTALAASAASERVEPAMATSAPASASAAARNGVQPRLSAVMIADLPLRFHSSGMGIFFSPWKLPVSTHGHCSALLIMQALDFERYFWRVACWRVAARQSTAIYDEHLAVHVVGGV